MSMEVGDDPVAPHPKLRSRRSRFRRCLRAIARPGVANLERSGSRRLGHRLPLSTFDRRTIRQTSTTGSTATISERIPSTLPAVSQPGTGRNFNRRSPSCWSTSARSATDRTRSTGAAARSSRSIRSGRGPAILVPTNLGEPSRPPSSTALPLRASS